MAIIYFAQAFRSANETDQTKKWPRVHAIIGDLTDGPVKIGYSTALYNRLTELSGFAKCRIWLVGAFVGTCRDECRMHRMFAHLRLPEPPFNRATTEWFRQDWELQTFIASLPRPPLTNIEYTRRSIKPQNGPPFQLQRTGS